MFQLAARDYNIRTDDPLHGQCSLQMEGDEMASKLLATRLETQELQTRIQSLKLQHTRLEQLRDLQQAAAGSLQSPGTTPDSHSEVNLQNGANLVEVSVS